MSLSTPAIRYSPDVETLQPDERETIQGLMDTFDTILERTAADYGHAVRSVHAKSHGILEAELVVDEGLPPELAQGLFAKPGAHKAYIRLSTNAGDILPDTIGLPRGLALKVLDAEGERLPGAEGSAQDFIMVNAPVFTAKTADKFLGNLKMLAATTDRMETGKTVISKVLQGVNAALGAVGLESSTLATLGGAPNTEPLGDTYYSSTPFRYGDYIAKFSLKPVAPGQQALEGRTVDIAGRENAIREEVQREMKVIHAEWEFRVQLCRDLDRQPVEDATVEWSQDEAPFQRVGVLRAAPQDSWDEGRVRQVNEEMRFGVWTGLKAHQPLGNINRARREPYRHSADFRARFNGCPYHEPSRTEG